MGDRRWACLVYFPDYRVLGQGYLKPGKFDLFLPEHGKDPLQLLVASRAIQVVVVIGLLLVTYLLLRRLFDGRSAFLATAFISLSPFFLGHSRLLNHEAMLGLFMLVSVLGMLLYLTHERKLALLLVSSTAGALAQLTKSSGILLFPVILSDASDQRTRIASGRGRGSNALSAAKALAIWLIGLAAAYVLFWPGMWVAPGRMLADVYGNAFTYAFQGARLSVVGQVQPSSFGLGTLGSRSPVLCVRPGLEDHARHLVGPVSRRGDRCDGSETTEQFDVQVGSSCIQRSWHRFRAAVQHSARAQTAPLHRDDLHHASI